MKMPHWIIRMLPGRDFVFLLLFINVTFSLYHYILELLCPFIRSLSDVEVAHDKGEVVKMVSHFSEVCSFHCVQQ